MVLMSTTIRSCIRLIPLLAVLGVAASLVPTRKAMGATLDPRLVKGAASDLGKLKSSLDKKLHELKEGLQFANDVKEQLQAVMPGFGGNSPSGAVGYVVDIGNQKFSVSGIDIDSPVTRTGMSVVGARAVLLYKGQATLFLGSTRMSVLSLYACSSPSTGGAILGLGRTGALARMFGTFSYVLSDRHAAAFRLGVGNAQQGRGGRPTPLIANRVYPDRYYVQMTSVLVGDMPLQIPPGALDIRRSDGSGGVYLSTTRPIGLVLRGEVYELLKAALQYSLGAPDANSQLLCYYAGATNKVPPVLLPTIKLVFANNAVMALPPGSSVWIPRKDGAHCLAVLRSATGETVLGTMVQMGRLMTYKLAADGVSGTVTF